MSGKNQVGIPPSVRLELMELSLVELRRVKAWVSDRIAEKERLGKMAPLEEEKLV